jgi:hypothetical protein
MSYLFHDIFDTGFPDGLLWGLFCRVKIVQAASCGQEDRKKASRKGQEEIIDKTVQNEIYKAGFPRSPGQGRILRQPREQSNIDIQKRRPEIAYRQPDQNGNSVANSGSYAA